MLFIYPRVVLCLPVLPTFRPKSQRQDSGAASLADIEPASHGHAFPHPQPASSSIAMQPRFYTFTQAFRSSRIWTRSNRSSIKPRISQFPCRTCTSKFSTASIWRQMADASKQAAKDVAQKAEGAKDSKTDGLVEKPINVPIVMFIQNTHCILSSTMQETCEPLLSSSGKQPPCSNLGFVLSSSRLYCMGTKISPIRMYDCCRLLVVRSALFSTSFIWYISSKFFNVISSLVFPSTT
jgi:hypothetical protein